MIAKVKAGKPTEFDKLVTIHEAEHQSVTTFDVHAERPADAGPVKLSFAQLGRAVVMRGAIRMPPTTDEQVAQITLSDPNIHLRSILR